MSLFLLHSVAKVNPPTTTRSRSLRSFATATATSVRGLRSRTTTSSIQLRTTPRPSSGDMRFSSSTALQSLAVLGSCSPLSAFSLATAAQSSSSSSSSGITSTSASSSRSYPISRFGQPTTSSSHRPSSFWTRLSSASSSSNMESKKDQTFPTWSYDGPCPSMEWSSLLDIDLNVAKADSVDSLLAADLILVGVMAPAKEDNEEEKEEDSDNEEEEEELAPTPLTGLAQDLETALGGGSLTGLIAENNKAFKNGAKVGSTTPVMRMITKDGQAKRIMFVGMGTIPKKSDDDEKKKKKDPLEGAGAALGKTLATQCQNQKKVAQCAILLPDSFLSLLSNDDNTKKETLFQDLSSSFYHNLYADNRYKSKNKVKKMAEDLKSVTLYTEGAMDERMSTGLTQGQQLASGIIMTKDIVNAPHNVLNSLSLADTAKRIAEQSTNGCIQCEILDKDDCERRGMGAFLGVARGSETEPQFIHLTYKAPSVKKKVAVVGKGLLFDTGGYNIKTQMMSLMKFDCGGAAAVLGAARAIGQLQPPDVEVHFIVAACENMINAKAMVPSDILTASNGKTIEVLNTDAEGRLTLADALVFADKEVGAESIIELSTLTGACMVSLGKQIAGVWTSNDDLASELEQASKTTGDKTWRMPLASEYNEELENSLVADLKNIGGKYGGAITAALFLQNFVSKKKPFAHIDIAGPVWNDKTGATGYGAQLVVDWIRQQGQPTSSS